MSGLKILVSYHKPSTLLKNSIFVPIHLGRSLVGKVSKDETDEIFDNEWMSSNMIGDNTGDNISHKNRELCELTAVYWAWKNLNRLDNPDYIGFMHYRRHLCFNSNCEENVDNAGLIYSQFINDEYIHKYGLSEKNINAVVKGKDIIVGEKIDVTRLGNNTNYDHYCNAVPGILHIEDYESVLKIVERLYPEYSYSIREYNSSRYAYFANIFIMKKEIFVKYADWLFSIISEAEKVIDLSNYNIQEVRALAYISEWLFGIWYTQFKKNKGYNHLELKRTFIHDTNYNVYLNKILPAFKNNNVPIVMSCDKNYVNYLGVAISSIFKHSDKLHNYDILILHNDISLTQQKEILSISNSSNHSIRFIKIANLLSHEIQQKFFLIGHFSHAVYYRLFIPQLFEYYDKVIYIDTDLVLNKDISELYDTELSTEFLLAAVKDIDMIRLTTTKEQQDFSWSHYVSSTLKLHNVRNYFNSGVLLFNIKQMIAENTIRAFFDTLERVGSPILVDQDILNIVCENRVKFIDTRWNVTYQTPICDKNWKNNLPCYVLNDYIQARNDPYIIHYAGCIKPWQDPSNGLTSYFWLNARDTIFYERILYQNLENKVKANEVKAKITLKELMSYRDTRAKYFYYKVLSKIVWGKKRKRYKEKRNMFREKISRVRKLLKETVSFYTK